MTATFALLTLLYTALTLVLLFWQPGAAATTTSEPLPQPADTPPTPHLEPLA